MATLVEDIIASTYVLLHNASDSELDYPVALEQLGSLLNIMRYEKVLGNLDDIIEKETLTFSDGTGITTNTISNFGDVIYLEFNNVPTEECPVSMLDLYYQQNQQRVAFWDDESQFGVLGGKKAQLAIPQNGTLKVWHEPDIAQLNVMTAQVEFRDSLKWAIATRLAGVLIDYVIFEDPAKMANKPFLRKKLEEQANHWEKIYLELVNRIGTNRPFSRLPFAATSGID